MYAELRARSAFSFLEGASLPETLAETAAELGIPAVALSDGAGVYGAPRFHKAMRQQGLQPIIGAEIPLHDGARLPLLVETREGYRNLCRLLSRMHLRAPKGEGRCRLEELAEFAPGLVALTGGESGPLPAALSRGEARRLLDGLLGAFGRENVFIEISRHHRQEQERFNLASIELADALRLPLLATNAVTYATAEARPVADVFACLRHHVRLDAAGRKLEANAERRLKSPAAMAQLFRDRPDAIAHSGELAARLKFQLDALGYAFPRPPVPEGETPASMLRRLTEAGAARRYGFTSPLARRARRQIERELGLIEKLGLEGYFLIVRDIVEFCREEGILAQGRGSAANSAVCYSLHITAVDPVGMELLFERFLSEQRGEWPDIDIDLPSGDRRERVIQHLYQRYGKHGAAMTANVITYRGRSAAREVGKVLDFPDAMIGRLIQAIAAARPPEPQDVVEHGGAPPGWDPAPAERPTLHESLRRAGFDAAHPRLRHFLHLCRALQDLPRHLGQHSGGMVLSDEPLDGVVPLENASMPGRVVVQWDKDDCAQLGIIKVDLLGLGMMAVLQDSLRMLHPHVAENAPEALDLAQFPPDDPKVYRMLCEADTIGVFQVESRAQMATLPRLRPQRFYDLVVEVGLIRPGPVAGNMVNPYLERRAGRQPITYPHPALEPILKRTLGVPLFQEQLLRMAMVAAGFTGGEAEELRRAFGFKRAEAKMSVVETKLRAGMAQRGITGEAAEAIIGFVTSFALYGFPESHAASFALLVYASAYLKAHYSAEFYAALLNNQPMGFYSPSTLVQDAVRHHVTVLPIAVAESDWDCTLPQPRPALPAFRLGLRMVSGLPQAVAQEIVAARRLAPFVSLDDLRRRTGLGKSDARLLASLGALPFHPSRRDALWQVERAWRPPGSLYEEDTPEPARTGPLPEMTPEEKMLADFRGSSLTLGPHPFALRRQELERQGVRTAAEIRRLPSGRRVRVAGMVLARQRPGTAKGIVFISLEDESGIVNIIVPSATFEAQRLVIVSEPALFIEGTLQNRDGIVHVKGENFLPLASALLIPSYDFH
ncbi:MAG TPA: error-prone DNA polymerase [Terriglobales bacterium]|nr:error-prone DNA polymerase [Terriglobales bacterium]